MRKFDGLWSEERVKDLIIAHEGRSHSECASYLSQKWDCLVTRDSVKNKFNSLNALKDVSGKVVNVEPSKSRDAYNKEVSDEGNKEKRTYIVTSAIAGCSLDKEFYSSIKTFCKYNNAKLVVFPMRGPKSLNEEYNQDVLQALENDFYTDYTFNSNIEGFDIMLSPTASNPLTGLYKIAEKSSVLIASPKQNMEVIPTGNVGFPHILQGTGAITKAIYSNNKIGLLAGNDHVVGAIIVQCSDNEIFHIRQVQANTKDGSFCDLDKIYKADKVESEKAEAFVLGDIHNGYQDESAMKAGQEQIDLLKPKYIALHDLFDSHSVSHWLENNITQKANRDGIFLTLKSELTALWDFLKDFSTKNKNSKILIVASNHIDHLSRYIDEQRFSMDYSNYRVALELAMYRLDGLNILQTYIEKNFGKLKNVVWLDRNDDYKVLDCYLGIHGDQGNNGARGSIGAIEKAYHSAFVGHSHQPKINSDVYMVGTCTRFNLPYVQGGSSWLHTNGVLHSDGSKQLITSIKGSWRL